MRLDHLLSMEIFLEVIQVNHLGRIYVSFALFNFEGLLFGLHEINTFYGGIAQLVEHLLCKQGVNGSSPFISTMITFCGL